MSIEAMKQALEALVRTDRISGHPNNGKTITALRAALYPDQHPRKPLIKEDVDFLVTRHSSFKKHWVGEELFVSLECDGFALVRAVERAHGIGEVK